MSPPATAMTPVPQTRPTSSFHAKLEDAVARCDEATSANEQVVDIIEELLNAGDARRPDRKCTETR